ncbi:MAG: tyrosinase family protein [Pyrinomonadaceae bacterium]
MPNVSRRSFLWGASTIPFALWFEKYASAQTELTRFNVTSAQGQVRLAQYRSAVGQMMAAPESSPTGWLFQWYTHNVRGDRTKAAELTRIYPSSTPQKALATEMWNTCQAHHGGDVEDYFLPWHRMYVFFLERIVRKISNDPTFTLPYWNYSNSAVPSGPRMPTAFINPAATTNSLFRSNRNTIANNGQPIDQNSPGALNLNALSQVCYSQQGAIQGFNLALDSGLHGTVHVLVGNGQGMGSVPFAANDPIFWMHHCNIDRLWASWNRAGRLNPTTSVWLDKQFIFADECGARVVGTVRDFRDFARLKYTYDSFAPVPATLVGCPPVLLSAAATQKHADVLSGPVRLGSAPVTVTLEPTPGIGAAAADIRPRVRNLKTGHRLFLVMRNLQTDLQPGVLYNVYLELPASASAQATKTRKVGAIHFFDAEAGHTDHEDMAGMSSNKFFSFDITNLARTLAKTGQLSAKPQVTIVPAGHPESSAQPVVGEISLVEQ